MESNQPEKSLLQNHLTRFACQVSPGKTTSPTKIPDVHENTSGIWFVHNRRQRLNRPTGRDRRADAWRQMGSEREINPFGDESYCAFFVFFVRFFFAPYPSSWSPCCGVSWFIRVSVLFAESRIRSRLTGRDRVSQPVQFPVPPHAQVCFRMKQTAGNPKLPATRFDDIHCRHVSCRNLCEVTLPDGQAIPDHQGSGAD